MKKTKPSILSLFCPQFLYILTDSLQRIKKKNKTKQKPNNNKNKKREKEKHNFNLPSLSHHTVSLQYL